ncbi:MAG: GNAT family N-acetyltransferase [Chloroflexota bacterium]
MRTIRKITEEDAAAYRTIRLRALREHPESYGATLGSMESQSIEDVAKRIRTKPAQGFCLFGAFVDEHLVGLAGFGRQSDNPKQRHRAGIFQMYVAPEYRGQKLGLQLLEATLEHARQLEGLEEVTLAVTVGNEAARNLYLNAGFRLSHIEPRYLKIDGTYYDIEWMFQKL